MQKTQLSKYWNMFLRGACLAGCLLMLAGSVPAETPSELLEKAKYKEETAGDVDAAIGLYREIIKTATANRHAMAEAHFRLGQCLIKQGKKDEGLKILKTLQEQYPDEKELVAAASKMTQDKLAISSAPWADKEAFTLSMKLLAGNEIGYLSYEASLLQNNGKECWEIVGQQGLSVGGFFQITRVVADKDTFAPITGLTSNTLMGEYLAEYAPEKVKLAVKSPQANTTKEIPISGAVYDNEQVLFMIRRLPLAEGYKASFTIFTVQAATAVECRIEVAGKEKKKTPAGEFECFKVQLEGWVGQTRALQHFIYYSTDAKHQVVYYDIGPAYLELVKTTNKSGKSLENAIVDDKNLRTSDAVTTLTGNAQPSDPAALYAQQATRQRVFRTQTDMRSLATAIESYQIDKHAYPAWSTGPTSINNTSQPTFRSPGHGLMTLTTPVAYISSYPPDAFGEAKKIFSYYNDDKEGWILWSPGPDGKYDITGENVARLYQYDPKTKQVRPEIWGYAYDATNGTVSTGDIFRFHQ